MKCKVCGGAGTSNTCVNGTFKPCSFCDGTGEYEPFDLDVELDKLDNESMTNEEWIKSANTEQLAEFVVKAMILYDNSEMTVLEAIKNAMKNDVKLSNYFMESLLEWLKQPHTP